jgi:hypothetical protein
LEGSGVLYPSPKVMLIIGGPKLPLHNCAFDILQKKMQKQIIAKQYLISGENLFRKTVVYTLQNILS